MNNDDVISVSGLKKSFDGRCVVNGIDLTVRRGEVFGFLGPNGSGKTTTIRMLCGLLTPDHGQGQCLGFDIRQQSHQIKMQIGYMTQQFSLYQDLSIQENLELIARLYGIKQYRQRVTESIERLDLGERRKQMTGTLSGGWKQRVALAACLLHQPKLLLLDEPTAGVDPQARREFWDHIHQLSHEGITTLVSTHYMDEAERCARLAYIAYGNLLIAGTKQEIIDYVGLKTCLVQGEQLQLLVASLQAMPGVIQAVNFGDALHVSGKDQAQLIDSIENCINPQCHRFEIINTNLEDSFIYLVDQPQESIPQ